VKVTDRVLVQADYTFTRAIDASTGLQLLRRPKEKWSATATWLPIDPLTLSATLLHVSDWLDVTRDGSASGILAPGYTIVNLRGDYAINDQVKVFGRVDNLFNLHYQPDRLPGAEPRRLRRHSCRELWREVGRVGGAEAG
jgi:vitamin B12 transporter